MKNRHGGLFLAIVTVLAAMGAGCELFFDDGDDSTGMNTRGGYFYLVDNRTEELVMLDRNMLLVRSWPFSDFTSGDFLQGVTYDGDALWVSVAGGDDMIYRLDLTSGDGVQVTRTFEAPPEGQGTVRDIAWDGEFLWVLNSGSVTHNNPPELFQLDPADGAILSRYELRSTEPRGLCHVGPNGNVYGYGAPEGCYYTDKDDDYIYVFDTDRRTFRNEGFPAPVGPRGENYVYPVGISFDGVDFWTANSSGVADYLFRLDYEGVKRHRVDLPYEEPGAIVWVDRDLGRPGPPVVREASPNTGAPTGRKEVVVKGSGFRDGLAADFGIGVSVDSVTSVTLSEFTAHITIAADADLGPRNITVTNPDGQQGVGVGLFTVVESDPSMGHLWFLDNANDVLHLYSINDGVVLETYDTSPVAPGGSLQGLAYDGTDLWLSAGGTDDIVVRIDTTGGVLSALHVFGAPPEGDGTVRDMAFNGSDLWIPNSGSDEIYRVRQTDGVVLETIPTPGGETRGITWADGRLYCNDKDTDAVYVWDAGSSSWTVAFEVPVPPGGTTGNRFPTGLTWDGVSFWLNNSTGEFDYIFQIAPDGSVLGTVEVPDRGTAQPTGLAFTLN
jgi:hypothetical protein